MKIEKTIDEATMTRVIVVGDQARFTRTGRRLAIGRMDGGRVVDWQDCDSTSRFDEKERAALIAVAESLLPKHEAPAPVVVEEVAPAPTVEPEEPKKTTPRRGASARKPRDEE